MPKSEEKKRLPPQTKSPTVWPLAFSGAILLWLSQPPLALSPLAWWALVPWGCLIARRTPLGRFGWWSIYLAGSLFWLVTLQGVRLAHPALYLGWIALAAYLGLFPLLSVVIGRLLTHRHRVSVWLAIPITWTGLELIRSHALTGLSAALLGHSQADFPIAIQIADIGGTYFVSFTIALVSGLTVALIMPSQPGMRTRIVPVVCTATIISMSFGYGAWRLQQSDQLAKSEPLLSALLIQRNEPLEFTLNPDKEASVFRRYVESSIDAITNSPTADVVVWPESMFTAGYPYRILTKPFAVPPDAMHFDEHRLFSESEFEEIITLQKEGFEGRANQLQRLLARAARTEIGPDLLLGTSVYEYSEKADSYCGAIHFDREGQVTGWYGKIHLVMFGEYIPFGTYFPWLYEVTPLRQGATPGKGPVVMEISGVKVAPSICFETMVEHATGDGLRRLRNKQQRPQLIVNLTNDAWFHGTSILTHHLRCSQLVAVSNRLPLLMTANQGPTTWIDSSGRQVETLAYQTDQALIARPTGDDRVGFYSRWGDRTTWPLAIVCILTGVMGFYRWIRP